MTNDDLEVTSVLDPDMIGKDIELTGQDIDFELDDSLLEDGTDEDFLDLGDLDALDDDALAPPLEKEASAPAASMPDDDEIDFELTEPVRETIPADDDIDFELEAPVAEPVTAEEPMAASEPEMEEVDFDLDKIIADSSEDVPAPLAVDEAELEEPVDFELEEVVEAAPQPEPEPEPEDASAIDTGMPEVPEYTPPREPEEKQDLMAMEFYAERIEAVVEKVVRETVTQVLERMLPSLVEEALTRELEKLNQDLDE